MRLWDFGRLGRLEAARQALEEASTEGLSLKELMKAAGVKYTYVSGGSTTAFLTQLTFYCCVYEDDKKRRYYLDLEQDQHFVRKMFLPPGLAKEDPYG